MDKRSRRFAKLYSTPMLLALAVRADAKLIVIKLIIDRFAVRSLALVACLGVTSAIAVITPQAAQAANDVAKKAVRAAKKAARAGDHEAAVELYVEAFEATDKPGFLVDAAGIEVTLGRYEQAYRRLERALNHGSAKRRLRRRIRRVLDKLEPQYQSAVQQRRSAEAARQSAEEDAQKRSQKARSTAAAEDQRRVLEAARKDLEQRQDRESKRRDRERAEEQAARREAEREWKSVAGWAAVATGLGIAGGGGWLLMQFQTGQAALNEEVGARNAGGKFDGLDYGNYRRRQEQLNQDATIAVTSVAAGGGVALLGAWFLISRPGEAKIALSPRRGGGLLVVGGAF